MQTPGIAVLLLSLAAGLVSAAPQAGDVEYVLYPVGKKPGETLREAINRASPIRSSGRTFHGHTQSSVQWIFDMGRSAGACRVVNINPRYRIVMTLPVLEPGPRVSFADKQAFARYRERLVEHENMHAEHTRQAAADIRRLVGLEAETCSRLEVEVNNKAKAVLEAYRREDRRMDALTDHGRRTGAYLN